MVRSNSSMYLSDSAFLFLSMRCFLACRLILLLEILSPILLLCLRMQISYCFLILLYRSCLFVLKALIDLYVLTLNSMPPREFCGFSLAPLLFLYLERLPDSAQGARLSCQLASIRYCFELTDICAVPTDPTDSADPTEPANTAT